MKALAELSFYLGNEVSGSDISYFKSIDYLNNLGIEAYVGVKEEIVKKAQLVVYSSSIKDDNFELSVAKKYNINSIERSEYLNKLFKVAEKSIVVCGSHGKSTTTSIISQVLEKYNYGLIGHIGADIIGRKSNLIFTGYNYFVSEGCEYKKNLLKLVPNIGIILNIDYDHPDCYKNLNEVKETFYSFAKNVLDFIIVHEDLKKEFLGIKKCVTFGKNPLSNYSYKIILKNKEKIIFQIEKNGKIVRFASIDSCLEINCLNYLAAYALLDNILDLSLVKGNIFKGIDEISRRCELACRYQNIPIYVDYCHHPKEIENTYCSFKEIYKNILVVFEPHTYSRTEGLKDEFERVFISMHEVVFLPTFAAREDKRKDIIVEISKKLNKTFLPTYEDAKKYIKINAKKYDAILILGAGNAYKIASQINMDKTVNNV